MRTGIRMIQKALTHESAAVVKQAVTLARRRGHGQVTPLHVASMMLASPTGLLRTSCLSSHSHPLQCKALELCFNVALNRLPSAVSSGPTLGDPHLLPSHPPLLSNALIAVLKRSQPHQRRGSVESQQKQILARKIELEQLVISILDDPSVSRVMREAGFSSSHVKSRVEQAVSIKVSSREPSHPKNTLNQPPRLAQTKSDEEISSGDDVDSLLDSMLGKKRNTVVIGEPVANAESIVRTVIDKLKSKSSSVQFISFPVQLMRNLSQDETKRKLTEIRTIISRSSYVGRRGIVLYLGDVEGVSEFWLNHVNNRRDYYCFSPLENVVLEIKKWCCDIGETRRACVLGLATLDSYKKCKFGQPSLENVWELHPLTLPSRSLTLSLNLNSGWKPEVRTDPKKSGSKWTLFGKSGDQSDDDKVMACCTDFNLGFNEDVQIMSSFRTGSEKLPPWLEQYKAEKTLDPFDSQGNVNIKNILCKKWSSFSGSFHNNHNPEKLLKCSSTPCLPTASSPSFNFLLSKLPSPLLVKEEVDVDNHCEDNRCDARPDLLSNPNSSPNSASSSEIMENSAGYSPVFDELTAENAKILTAALEAKVPWQRDVIPAMVDTVLSCRLRKSTWMAISGSDTIGKEKFARELGKVVYGSHSCFVSVTCASVITESSRKRAREQNVGGGYLRILREAVNENPYRVFFLEGFDRADEVSKTGITKAICSGKLSVCDRESVSLRNAIVILTYEHSDLRQSAKRPRVPKEEEGKHEVREEEDTAGGSNHDLLDLNVAIEDRSVDDEFEIESDILNMVDGKFIFQIQEV